MQIDAKHFNGLMNTDDALPNIGANHHRLAFNGRFRGSGNSLRFENVEGTSLLNNPYLPDGINECIGGFYDELRQRIITFNYNSKGSHAIYQYSLSSKAWLRIVMVGYNTVGDILNFTVQSPIYAAKILYGDASQGDTIFFNNCQQEPCEVNIDRALNGSYGSIKREYINVIKAPAAIPPAVTYEDDATVTVNNFRKQLLRYKTRFVYKSLEKSVWSAYSELPLPINYTGSGVDKDPTKNCRVAIVVPTGDEDVSKIEIAAELSNGNTFGDGFEIASLDKAALSIPSNDIYAFRFFNNQAYAPIDLTDSIQLFDWVPLKAVALEILNGNVPVYGCITEGYEKTAVSGTASCSTVVQNNTQLPYIYVTSQSGDSGFGAGDIHIIIIGQVAVNDYFYLFTTNEILQQPALVPGSAGIISALSGLALSLGFTIVSSDTENLVINKTGESLQLSYTVPSLRLVKDSFVYDRNSRYNNVIVYFDKAGRSIGSQTSADMNVQTINYSENTLASPFIPKLLFSITSRPPLYAAYFHIARTKNLSKLTKLEWVSFATFKDSDYAYISIENLNLFILENPSSKFLAYDFSANDRIRFMKKLSGTVNTVYTDNDFEINSQVLNPVIAGVAQPGQFLKIALPAVNSIFNFGTPEFNNYFIELYTPAKPSQGGFDLDYEFSQRFAIGNQGTATAFHQGGVQNQTANLSLPALFEFTKGDFYYRNRKINAGNSVTWNIAQQTFTPSGGKFWPALTLATSLIDPTLYSVQSTSGAGPSDPGNNNWAIFKKNRLTNAALLMEGTIIFTSNNNLPQGVAVDFGVYDSTGTNPHTGITLNQTGPVVAGIEYTLTFNVNYNWASGYDKGYFGVGAFDSPGFQGSVRGNISIKERDKIFTVGVIDPNFSDFFESAVNSNGRAWFVDANAGQVTNNTLMRWGLAYEPNTNINQANRFKPLNLNEADRSRGRIQCYKAWGDRLRIFFERGVAVTGIYSKFLETGNGASVITTTDDIITKNNFNFYEGHYGVGNQPTGIVSAKGADYFIDPIRGYQVRLGANGSSLAPISELYKGQFFIQPLFVPYGMPYAKTNGGKSKIIGCYNYYEEEYISSLEGGVYAGSEVQPYTFSFNEKRNAYSSFFEFFPEWLLSAEDKVYSFLNGQMFVHDNKNKYTNFYGVQRYPSIVLPFNDKEIYKKTYLSLGYQSNALWVAPQDGDILTTALDKPNGLPQISKLKDFNFQVVESERVASFQRDINSRPDKRDAWYNGDILKGWSMEVKLTYFGSGFTFIYLPYIKYVVSSPNL